MFGDVVIRPMPDMHGFPSSLDVENLNSLETRSAQLSRRREWPERFGALDQSKVDAGRALYEQKGCLGCHTNPPAGNSIYNVKMVPLTRDSQGTPNRNNTDPWMACNAISYASASGKLEGRPENYLKGDRCPRKRRSPTMLTTTVVGTLLAKWQEILKTAVDIFFGVEPLPRVAGGDDAGTEEAQRAARLDAMLQREKPALCL